MMRGDEFVLEVSGGRVWEEDERGEIQGHEKGSCRVVVTEYTRRDIIGRLREKSSVAPCTKVTLEVRHAILGSLKEYAQKAKEKRGDFGEENPYGRSLNDFDGDDIQEIPSLEPKEFQSIWHEHQRVKEKEKPRQI
ncbi:hypothetical protein ACH5RR_041225 [Cinchona calisaya]|uniref:Uncharacterized protein n=1 Tax=Cinchona calisaya TaxID=153742 RepID=A0ABD2XTU0_9GENT